jgi:phage-related protein
MAHKPVIWMGSAKAALKAFPALARREAGHDLWFVQTGRAPRSWRPMPDVGEGVLELRVHCGTDHRVFYVAKFNEGVYVLHAFEKRSQTTNKNDLAIGRRRYREALARRATKAH